MRWSSAHAVVLALAIGAGGAQAQVGWESPMLATPDQPVGWGAFLVAPAFGDLGAMGTWRGSPGLGLRLGIAEDASDEIAVFGGVDLQGGLLEPSGNFPLELDWVVGAGVSVGEGALISVPAGLTLGRRINADGGVSFTPYLTPRLVLDLFMDDAVQDDTSLEFVADLGVDLQLQPGWAIRFGFTLGDRGDEAIAIGIVF